VTLDLAVEKAFRTGEGQLDVSKEIIRACRGNARRMLADLKKVNPKQHDLVRDPHTHCAATCPRRAGKTYAAVIAALVTGESKPGAISIIISLNKQQLRRLYWDGPTGIEALARKYKVELQLTSQYLRWRHLNGSYGYLLGADDDEQLEVLRGLEADLYIIDESQAFPPARLQKLLTNIIEPQRASRQGKILLIGTPGYLAAGPFYQASCPQARDKNDQPWCVPYGQLDPDGRDIRAHRLWSYHHWTLQDNSALPHQWEEALVTKAKNGWTEEDPTWCQEYLGLWTLSSEGLVFRYATERDGGRLNWVPKPTLKNPTGLPEEGAPWRLIGGLDIGFEDATAFVVAGYSARLRQLRHVWDVSRRHMLVDDLADLIRETYERFGSIEKIFADVGALGKMVVETLIQRHGFPIERADKREKPDHVELLNSAFSRGEVLIVEGTALEEQLLTNAWDLRDGKKEDLARVGRLREDPATPNDSTDAFLYLYRGSLHHFGAPVETQLPTAGSPEWVRRWEKEQLRRARESVETRPDQRLGDNRFTRAPFGVRMALQKGNRWTSTPTRSRR
jgi:hypothetical protein